MPVRLIKENDLFSVDKSSVINTMTSSGTSGQKVSKIYLDKYTSNIQMKALSSIVSDFIGINRLPMLIIDSKTLLNNRSSFSARVAGVLGFSRFGRDITFALSENMEIDYEIVESFCKKYEGMDVLIFGFTSIIWEYFHKSLQKNNKKINLINATMIHGGGWKKLIDKSVDNETFRQSITESCNIHKIHNYYGMIEQTGSIFMECQFGFLHCSDYSDMAVLNNQFHECNQNEIGLVKLYSLLPYSYPGHILLTEDSGEIIGEDDCACGRAGKYFKIHGRIPSAEIRGCSDTFEPKI